MFGFNGIWQGFEEVVHYGFFKVRKDSSWNLAIKFSLVMKAKKGAGYSYYFYLVGLLVL